MLKLRYSVLDRSSRLTRALRSRTAKRVSLLVFAAASFFITVWAGTSYRSAAYARGFGGIGLADIAPSIGGTMVVAFLCAGLIGKTRPLALGTTIGAGIGGLLYEFLQPTLGTGVFDWADVIGVLVGLALAYSIVWRVWRADSQVSGG